MLKVVLDTNVLISALLFGGKPGRTLWLVRRRQVIGVMSSVLIAELTTILKRKFNFSDTALRSVRCRIERAFVVVTPNISITVLADDADNRVLEAAVEGGCDFIVTGDKVLLVLKMFRGVQLVTPAQFLAELA